MKSGNADSHFIDEPIAVMYTSPPLLEKKPTCPDKFKWLEKEFVITDLLLEWVDYTRRGRMARNMSDAHTLTAAINGSWGVGRFYFRVKTAQDRVFDIYYDRAPKGVTDRKGQWFVLCEYVQ
jgi:hypothetical protein